jgi:hypothetical protein
MTSFEKSQARFLNIFLPGQEGTSSPEWVISGGGRQNVNAGISFLFELSDMTSVVPLSMILVYLFSVWSDKRFLPGDSRGIKLI